MDIHCHSEENIEETNIPANSRRKLNTHATKTEEIDDNNNKKIKQTINSACCAMNSMIIKNA